MGCISSQEVSKQASRFVCKGGRLTLSVSGKVPRENQVLESTSLLPAQCQPPSPNSATATMCSQEQEVNGHGLICLKQAKLFYLRFPLPGTSATTVTNTVTNTGTGK